MRELEPESLNFREYVISGIPLSLRATQCNSYLLSYLSVFSPNELQKQPQSIYHGDPKYLVRAGAIKSAHVIVFFIDSQYDKVSSSMPNKWIVA